MRQTITFNEVAIYGQKSVKCAAGCKRTLRRSRKFWQTLNPFNKNAAGEPKTRGEIQDELIAQRGAWLIEPEVCSHCGTASRAGNSGAE